MLFHGILIHGEIIIYHEWKRNIYINILHQPRPPDPSPHTTQPTLTNVRKDPSPAGIGEAASRLTGHQPAGRLPPRKQLELRDGLLGDVVEAVDEHPRTAGFGAQTAQLLQEGGFERFVCELVIC